jgi:hypothetical protein
MLAEGARKTGPREEQIGVLVIVRRRPGHDLFKRDSEFVGIERPALSNFFSWCDHFVPRFHQLPPPKIPGYARFQRAFALAQKHARSVRSQASSFLGVASAT